MQEAPQSETSESPLLVLLLLAENSQTKVVEVRLDRDLSPTKPLNMNHKITSSLLIDCDSSLQELSRKLNSTRVLKNPLLKVVWHSFP